jgi:hypothetical protein
MEPGENVVQKRSHLGDPAVRNREFLGFISYYAFYRVLRVCFGQI